MPRYSNDLRMRVAKKLSNTAGTKAYNRLSIEFEICVDTLRKWKKKLDNGTLYDEIHIGGHPVVYDLEGLKKFVEEYPDKYIREIKEEFFEAKGNNACETGITKALNKMNFRLKKKSRYTKKLT